jgi:hypothetical protein
VVSKDIFDCHDWRGGDAAKYLMYRIVFTTNTYLVPTVSNGTVEQCNCRETLALNDSDVCGGC